MNVVRPGLDPRRLHELMRDSVARCRVNLAGRTVLTEAASGAYVVTPVLAALAGADRVIAVARSTRYGTAAEIHAATRQLALLSGVADRIELVTEVTPELVGRADIITNSGHVRPIDAAMVQSMKPGAVVALMFEAWEFRPADLDLDACTRAGIAVGGTNERHPDVDVFSYLGLMAVKLLLEAGVAVYKSSILLVCDNPFESFLANGLRAAGAAVETTERIGAARGTAFDAVVISRTPGPDVVLNADDARLIGQQWPGAVVAQFWGDIDRAACARAGVPVWRAEPPRLGHMGILLSDLGPEPIVRLQTGGLKAGEVLARYAAGERDVDLEFVEILNAEALAPCEECC